MKFIITLLLFPLLLSTGCLSVTGPGEDLPEDCWLEQEEFGSDSLSVQCEEYEGQQSYNLPQPKQDHAMKDLREAVVTINEYLIQEHGFEKTKNGIQKRVPPNIITARVSAQSDKILAQLILTDEQSPKLVIFKESIHTQTPKKLDRMKESIDSKIAWFIRQSQK